jgi:hypothetical protein
MLQDVNAASQALFLDLDGTLIDIAPTPGSIFIPDDLAPLIGGLGMKKPKKGEPCWGGRASVRGTPGGRGESVLPGRLTQLWGT